MGVGRPGDIERLDAAIELASTEGFTRSAADVSLRRLAHYSLSPVLKTAFEQVYGAPYLARLLFAEIGAKQENDLFLRLEYDGAIATNNATFAQTRQDFGALSGTRQSTELMEKYGGSIPPRAFERALSSLGYGRSDTSLGDAAKDLPALTRSGPRRAFAQPG